MAIKYATSVLFNVAEGEVLNSAAKKEKRREKEKKGKGKRYALLF